MTDVCQATGKERLTRKRALAKARWWRHAMLARMTHYRCNRCGAWHVGNNRAKPRRQKR